MQTKSITISFRVRPKLNKLLRTVSEARGEDISDFIRRAILRELAQLSYFDDDQKKALGINSKHVPSGVFDE